MAKRKSFFDNEDTQEDAVARQKDVKRILEKRQAVVQDIPVELIEPNPFQVRRTFDGIDELAAAIRAQGFISRLRVRPHPEKPGFYQLTYGERRLMAAKEAGLVDVPCEIAQHTDEEMIEIGLSENINRKDLNPLEEARGFRHFLDMRSTDGKPVYSYRSLEEKIGKSLGYIQNRLKILELPADIQVMVEKRDDTLKAARELNRIPTPAERAPLIEKIVAGGISFKDVEQEVRRFVPEPNSDEVLPSNTIPERIKRSADRLAAKRYKKDFEAIDKITLRWFNSLPSLEAEERRVLQEGVKNTITRLQTIADRFEMDE